MTKIFIGLLYALFGIAALFASDKVDSFFVIISNYKEFACSVKVVQYSQFDTIIDNGFIVWNNKNFFAHLGDEFFLRDSTGEFLTWSEGGDAMPSENEFVFGDFVRMQEKLTKKFSLLANFTKNSEKLLGAAKSDENPIAKFLIVLDSKNKIDKISLWDRMDIRTDIIFDNPLKKMPDKSTFTLPAGVDIVR